MESVRTARSPCGVHKDTWGRVNYCIFSQNYPGDLLEITCFQCMSRVTHGSLDLYPHPHSHKTCTHAHRYGYCCLRVAGMVGFFFVCLHVASVIFTGFGIQMSVTNPLFTCLLCLLSNIFISFGGKQHPEEGCGLWKQHLIYQLMFITVWFQ